MSPAISMLCSARVTRRGSDSPSSSTITAHSIRPFRMSEGIRVLSFAPSFLELSKTTISLLSLHAVYMLPNSPLLMCKQPLYDIDMQRAFPAFLTKATRGQSRNYRKLANPRDKKNHENMNAKSDELSDIEDDYECPKQEFVSEFPADSYDHNVKPSSTAASSASEIVALFMKVKSQPKDDSHVKVKDQGVQMSEAKPTKTVGSAFLEVLQKYLPEREVQKKKAPHFEARRRQRALTTQSVESNSFPKAPHTQSVKTSASSIKESSVPRQQDQWVSASCQPGSRGLVDDHVNLIPANKAQLKSILQSTTAHMLDTPHVNSVKTSESVPDQLASSLIEHMDLSTLRIPEMRIIAKSRGLKGYSKLKKGELLELLRKK